MLQDAQNFQRENIFLQAREQHQMHQQLPRANQDFSEAREEERARRRRHFMDIF